MLSALLVGASRQGSGALRRGSLAKTRKGPASTGYGAHTLPKQLPYD